MALPSHNRRVVRFADFEVNFESGELRRRGVRLKLPEQAFQVLSLLVEKPGELVTREELQQKLWSEDTFVDFDTGLNSTVKRLRDILGDSADHPRFIETLPRRGYRLMVPVEWDGAKAPAAAPKALSAVWVSIPRRIRMATLAALALGAILGVLLGLNVGGWRGWISRPPAGPYSIAVLPFKNLSSEPESDYFSDGLTDEIIHNLSLIEGLEVRSRTSSFAFKDKPRSMREVGAQLGASFVLEGSVLRSGEMLRVHAQLVRVSDDTPLWSRRYDRELKDVFTIQDEISRSVVNELRLKLGTGQRRYNTSSEAYDLYLKALPLRHADPTARAELFKAIELLEQVIAKDPDFAPAYAGLAKTYATLSIIPQRAPEGVSEKMRAAARRALELDPLLAEAYEGMGLVYGRDLAWDDADRAFRRALQINPNLAGAHGSLGILLWERGRLPDGLQEMRTAVKLDPLSADHHRELAFALIAAGQYAEALAHCDRALALRPGDPLARQYSGRALMHQGRLNEAIAVFEQLRDGSAGFRAYAYARAGRRAEAEQIAAKHPDWPNIQVLAYAGLGETDRALEALERMAALHDPRVDLYPFFPELASLRDDPRLKEFRRKRGLSWPP